MKIKRYFLGFFYGVFQLLTLRLHRAIKMNLHSNQIICIYFHDPTKRKFYRIIKWLNRNRFHFISERDVIDFIYHGKVLKGTVWITFDDGWRNNMKLIPIIEEYKIPPTFFLTTYSIFDTGIFWNSLYSGLYSKQAGEEFHILSYSEKIRFIKDQSVQSQNNKKRQALTIEEAKELGRNNLISIGSHTHHHISLVNSSFDEVCEEINLNIKFLSKITDNEIMSFSFPSGKFDYSERDCLKKNKILIGVTTDNGIITNKSDPYYLPRIGIWNYSYLENICRIMNCWK